MKKIILSSLLMLTSLGPAVAQIENVSGIVDIKGMGNAPLGKGPNANADSEKEAVRQAAINAVDRALQLQSSILRQQYDERIKGKPEREKMVRALINDMEAETERVPKEGITFAKIKGKIDIQALRDLLNRLPKAFDNRRADLGVAVFFTVRRTAAKSSSAELVVDTDEAKKIAASGQEDITDTGINRQESKSTSSSAKVGLTSRETAESTEFEFDPQMKEAFGAGLLQKLSAKGFEAIEDGAFFDVSDEMDKDMTNRGSLSKETMLAMVNELQEDPDLEICVYGNLDFSLPYKDPITGMAAVKTTMLAKVYRIIPGKKRPKFIGGIGPKSYTGKGHQEEDAKKDILEAMAPLAADEIVAALKNNNIIE